ncbi:MAG: phospholipase D-like domain-containing protein [Minisyncoccia bacterium]
MFLSLHTRSTDAWDAMFSSMVSAQKSIYIEMYTFSDDTKETHDFVSLLSKKAREGVHVAMILDSLGSLYLSRSVITTLRSAGVEVFFYGHWLYRTHRKFVIVDEARAFVGGVNIVQYSFAWRDLQIELSGYIVQRLTAVFAKNYKELGGKKVVHTLSQKKRERQQVRAWLLDHTPFVGRKRLRKYYEDKIQSARRSIVFITPYFIPSAWLFDVLRHAIVVRKLRVTILLPQHTDPLFVDHANRYYALQMTHLGASVYLVPGMNHGKAVLIDASECLIGSANVDPISFERNNELGVFFTDTAAVRALTTISAEWQEEGTLFTASAYHLTWYEWIFTYCVRFMHPFL